MLTEKIEFIIWRDSYGCSPAWEEIPEKFEKIPALLCYSTGFVIGEDEHNLLLVPHVHDGDEAAGTVKSGCGDMTIPKAAIVSRIVLGGLNASGGFQKE